MRKWMVALSTALFVVLTSAAACAEPAAAGSQQSLVQQIREAGLPDTDLKGQQARDTSLSARIRNIMTEDSAETNGEMSQKPKVVIMYVNNAKSTYDGEVDKEIFKYLNKALPEEAYTLVDGAPYIEKLNKLGYMDISTAERADFMDAFAGADIDYCIYLEIAPFVARDKMTFFTIGKDITTAIPLKIINLSTGKYIYTGKFTEKASDSTIIGDIGNKSVALKALDSAGGKIVSVIQERLPKMKNASPAGK